MKYTLLLLAISMSSFAAIAQKQVIYLPTINGVEVTNVEDYRWVYQTPNGCNVQVGPQTRVINSTMPFPRLRDSLGRNFAQVTQRYFIGGTASTRPALIHLKSIRNVITKGGYTTIQIRNPDQEYQVTQTLQQVLNLISIPVGDGTGVNGGGTITPDTIFVINDSGSGSPDTLYFDIGALLDGNGIYGGSDTVPYGTVATIDSGIVFRGLQSTTFFNVDMNKGLFGTDYQQNDDKLKLRFYDLASDSWIIVDANGINIHSVEPDKIVLDGATRITDLVTDPATKLVGTDIDGDLSSIVLSNHFRLNNDTLDIIAFDIQSGVYRWKSAAVSIGTDPSDGRVAVNNNDPLLATHVVISKLTHDNIDISFLIQQLHEGDVLRIQSKDNSNNWIRYNVDSIPLLQGTTHFSILVSAAAEQGTEPLNNHDVLVSFYLNSGGAAIIADGDYGDIDVSLFGTVWKIDTAVVGPIQLANTTVAPGTYTNMTGTVDADGRLTAASSGSIPPTNLSFSGVSSPVTLNSSTGTGVTITAAGINTLSATLGNITITAVEVDGSTSNELQTVSNTSNATSHTLTLSNSGGSMQIVEGAGIDLATTGTSPAGVVTVTNTLPDQTVVLTSGTGISTAGTYPNFTITNTSINTDGQNLSIGGTGPTYTLDISGGTGTTFQGSGIVTLSESPANTLVITATEVDGSTSNELQTFGHSGTTSYTNTLSNGGGSFTLQASGINAISHTAGTTTITATEVDGSVSNEGSLTVAAGAATTSIINSNTSGQTGVTLTASTGLSIGETGNVITLTNSAPDQTVSLIGAGINNVTGSYPNFTITGTEVDGSISNELQTLSSSGTATTFTTALSNTGGSLKITEGTGIDVVTSGTALDGIATITNTAPDQVVALTGAGITNVTGTYPSFTITSTEVDASISNEGSLTVGAGTVSTSIINSNTSGSAGVTLTAAGILTTSEVGNVITMTATEVDGSISNELQTVSNTSDATSHTATLSNSGGSVQLVEGTGITLTTTGTSAAGVVTIASSGGTIPTGADAQTLRYSGTTLTANSQITNNGIEVGIGASPLAGFELYVNGSQRTDGTIVSRGTGTTPLGNLTTPAIRLWNTTATVGDIWHLASLNNGTFGIYSSNLGTSQLEINNLGNLYTAGNIGVKNFSPSVSLDLGSTTDGIGLSTGTTAQRPVVNNVLRNNTTVEGLEYRESGVWYRITSSKTPTIAAGVAAGTAPTVAITGNDLGGQIVITVGTSPTTGTLCQVTYSSNFDAAIVPYVTITPANDNAAARIADWRVGAFGNTSFILHARVALAASTQYIFNYQVQQ